MKPWNPKGFQEVDKIIVDTAKSLLSNKLISYTIEDLNIPNNTESKNSRIIISFPKGICRNKKPACFINNYGIYKQGHEDSKQYLKHEGDLNKIDLRNSKCSKIDKDCNLNSCPFLVAAYMDYLKRTEEGKLEELISLNDNNTILKIENKIEELIVTDEVKDILYKNLQYFKFVKNNKEKGDMIPRKNLSFLLLGNPGTGKINTANVIASMLFETGYTSSPSLITLEYDGIMTKAELEKIFIAASNKVLLIKGVDGADVSTVGSISRDRREKADLLSQMIVKYHKSCTIILSGDKNEVLSYVSSKSSLNKIFQTSLYFPDMDNSQLYEIFKKICASSKYKIEEDFELEFYKYLEANKKQSHFQNGEFVEQLFDEILTSESNLSNKHYSDKIIKKEFLPKFESKKIVSSNTEIDSLVGMHSVKLKIKELQAFLKYNKKLKAMNHPIIPLNLHMLFTGNPGTGKTTVARMVTKILYDLGYIKENKLIEVERKDLIAEYLGQTAIKTGKAIQKAKGGVLFIDEAYSITNESKGGYGDECIATLIKSMEDCKEDLVVIFAGYKKEMEQFINSNSGLSSRIGNSFDFEDYTEQELLDIFKFKIKAYKYWIDKDAYPLIEDLLIKGKSIDNFGNGRYVDNIIQSIILKHAINTENDENQKVLTTITKQDIPIDIQMTIENKNKTIGFI